MLRTKREVLKYEQQLREIDEALKRPIQTEDQQQKNYQRIFQKIINDSNQDIINKEFQAQKRGQLIQRMQGDFQSMFSQLYETVGYKDRLKGLTDNEIKEEIIASPYKTQARQRLQTLRSSQADRLDEESRNTIKENKLQQLQLAVEKSTPEDNQVYRILESAEERTLRLQINYLKHFLQSQDNAYASIFDRLKGKRRLQKVEVQDGKEAQEYCFG